MRLGYFILILASTQVDAGSYVVTFPNALIPGVDLDLRILALKASGIVHVLAELQHANRSVITTINGQVSAGVPGVIKLAVPDDLPNSMYKVVVSGSGGLVFRNESGIRYENNNLLTLLQTDKTRYSGGQEVKLSTTPIGNHLSMRQLSDNFRWFKMSSVKYRAILLRPNMLGYKGPVTLTITDGDDNKIEVTEYNTTKDGVISGSLLLSREPVFGIWTISVQAMGKSYGKIFEVNDYVLPKFRVDIELPDNTKDTDSSFEVSVSARFTFKSDVYGNCTIQIYNVDSTTHYVVYEKKIIGVVNFTVPMSDLRSKLQMYSEINVRALVTDNATALTMANEKSLEIKSDKNNEPITITKIDSRDYFIPGLNYQTPIFVARKGEPVTSTGVVHVTPTVVEAQSIPCLKTNPPTTWLKIETSVKSAFTVPVDKNGYGVLNYQMSSNANKVDFRLSFESETIKSDTLTLHSVSSDPRPLLSLSVEKAITRVGEKTRVTVESTEDLLGIVSFEIYSRGRMLDSQIVQLNNGKRSYIDIDVTADMVPQMYVMATHVTQKGQLIQNYAVSVIDGFPYRNKVNVTYNTTFLQPREGIQLGLYADPNSTVYLLVEDESNRLFGTENDIFTKDVITNGNHTSRSTRSADVQSMNNVNRVIVLADVDMLEKSPIHNLLMYNKGLLPTECSLSAPTGTSAVHTQSTTAVPRTPTTTARYHEPIQFYRPEPDPFQCLGEMVVPVDESVKPSYNVHKHDLEIQEKEEMELPIQSKAYSSLSRLDRSRCVDWNIGGSATSSWGYIGGGGGGGGGCGKRKRHTPYPYDNQRECNNAAYSLATSNEWNSSKSEDTLLPRGDMHIFSFASYSLASNNAAYSLANLKPDTMSSHYEQAVYKLPTISGLHDGGHSLQQQPTLELKTIVRTKFPETWLWEEYEIGDSGKLMVDKNVPDSLTTWVTSAFATNRISGFGLSEMKQKITVKKNFFLTMALPQSIVYGETFLLQITIFNYLSSRQQVQLQIEKSDDTARPVPASAAVNSGQGHSTYIEIRPSSIGTLKITVLARAGNFFTTTAIDKLEKEVTVRPQGVKRTINQQRIVIVNSNGQTYSETIDLNNTLCIPNTKSIHAKITGDIMVPTIKGLQDLIELPDGCGEQVMVNFAPDVYITKYMKSTGQLSKDDEKKALSNILSGYQRELHWKRSDGSFSIWGNRDPHGSTWLTAYVLKCFYQARELITIDGNVLSKAMAWLMSKQASDGSFIEQLQVYYVDHRHTEVGLKLTAFTIISLLEARNIQKTSIDQLNTVLAKGTHHLENKLNGITDAYTLSIVCYALAKAGSTSAHSCFTKLERCKHSLGDMIYWTETTSVSRRELYKRNLGTRAPARDIETTAYALLAYHTLGRHAEALPIVKWIVSQRNPNGGFRTTQDTVISIQALTEFSQMLPRKNTNDNVNFHLSGPGFSHKYTTSQSNHDLLHTQEIPLQVGKMDIKATGHGMAILDVVQTFYVANLESNVDINVNATIQKETLNSITVRPLVSWNGQSKSSMLIVAVELPTGFVVDEEFLKKQSLIRRHETNGRNVDLYFDGIDPQKQIHVDVKMDRSDPVVGNQACHITAYDYYEPEKHAMTLYESGVLKRANICDVCPSCNMCTGSGNFNQIGIGR